MNALLRHSILLISIIYYILIFPLSEKKGFATSKTDIVPNQEINATHKRYAHIDQKLSATKNIENNLATSNTASKNSPNDNLIVDKALPQAQSDNITLIENTKFIFDPLVDNGNGADSTVDGNPLEVVSITQPTNGSANLNNDGTISYQVNDFSGTTNFTYTIRDTVTNERATGTVNVTVVPDTGTPFPCDDSIYQVISGVLKRLDLNGNYETIGEKQSFSYNAMGYNINDNYLYALIRDKKRNITDSYGNAVQNNFLIRIDSEGKTLRMVNQEVANSFSGHVYEGELVVREGNMSLSKIDLTNFSKTTYNLEDNFRVADFVIVNGKVYGIDQTRQGTLLVIDLNDLSENSDAPVQSIPIGGYDMPRGLYGASFVFDQSKMLFSFNGRGLYEIQNFDTNSPTAIYLAPTIATRDNDGASCDASSLPVFDFDKDGVPDDSDIDDDNDGILDTEEKAIDTDGDLIPNKYDRDSDNDGIPDTAESQGVAVYTPPSGSDADGDGLDDAYDNENNTGVIPLNSDGADNPDFLDIDSDNDGIFDVVEAGKGNLDTNDDGQINPLDRKFNDFNNDGMKDDAEDIPPLDSDNDGLPNHQDLDADNDGIFDVVEGGDGQLDTNKDGKIDENDVGFIDADQNGEDDRAEDTLGLDSDGDGRYDYIDIDSDNDGIFDAWESGDADYDSNQDGRIDSNDTAFSDTNNNGADDRAEATPTIDSDGDGEIDALEIDADNDGCSDTVEAGYDDGDGDGILGSAPLTVDSYGQVVSQTNGYSIPLDGNNDNILDFQQIGNAPNIVAQPMIMAAVVNQTTTITMQTDGNSVQWQLWNGSSWDDLADSNLFSGTETPNLTINRTPISLDKSRFRALVRNSDYRCNRLISNEALLILDLKPTIITNRTITYRLAQN